MTAARCSRRSSPRTSRLVAPAGGEPVEILHTREVIAAIGALPQAQREVVAAVDVAGLGYTEAADAPADPRRHRHEPPAPRPRAARDLRRGRVERAPVGGRRRPHDRGEVMPERRRAREADAPRRRSRSTRPSSPAAPGSRARAARAASGRASSRSPCRKRRVNVRTLMYARPASASRSSGSSRRSSAHAITRGDRVVVGMRGHRQLDQLRLAAVAVGRDHQPARDGVGDLAPVVAAHDVQAQVDPRGAARRRQHACRRRRRARRR